MQGAVDNSGFEVEQLSQKVDVLAEQIDKMQKQVDVTIKTLEKEEDEKQYYMQQQFKTIWKELRKLGSTHL